MQETHDDLWQARFYGVPCTFNVKTLAVEGRGMLSKLALKFYAVPLWTVIERYRRYKDPEHQLTIAVVITERAKK